MAISILLIDDNIPFRQGVRTFLEMEPKFKVVGEAKDGKEGLSMVKDHNPAVVIMDWVMPGIGGLEATRLMKKNYPLIAVIILSMHADLSYVLGAIQSGAHGYIVKEDTVHHLPKAILAVHAGCSYFSPQLKNKIPKEILDNLLLSDFNDENIEGITHT